ncbi:hypothetical protein Gotri_024106 [Gossypium trilobum]|uniref:Uncharacterized protein n=1 Tax=Gossypium trilobum TaxID=34281 RepID=A0A7J9DLB7_9ROSI|nr:hypothetical protein [Gossypium trilobum]
MILKDNVVVSIVQEFYASLWDQESRNIECHMWDIVLVRWKEVRVTPRIIYDFYNAPYYEKDFIDETDLEYFRDIDMDNIINFLIEGVPKTSTKQPLKPSKSIIEDTLFQQYIKLRAKEVKDWNKRQQGVMTTPASS